MRIPFRSGALLLAIASLATGKAAAQAATAPDGGPLEALQRKTAHVNALLEGSLEAGVRPAALFDVALEDATAIAVEVSRLKALARGLEPVAPKKDAGKSPAAASGLELEFFAARRELDLARLRFYALPIDARARLLQAATPPTPDAGQHTKNEAEARDQERQAERDRAVAAAAEARSEAAKLSSGEHLRLLDVERAQEAFAQQLAEDSRTLVTFREATLAWQRRAREAKAASGPLAAAEVDALYDKLRLALKGARAELAQTLDRVGGSLAVAPGAGPDPLADLPAEADHQQAQQLRLRVEATEQSLLAEQTMLVEERASRLLEQIDVLNRERLGLLEALSDAKQRAITGLTPAAIEQSASELTHLALILRYHRHATARWLRSMRDPGQTLTVALGRTLVVLVQWGLVLGLFLLWRRRATPLLLVVQRRIRVADRLARATQPGRLDRLLGFFIQIRRPLEWLLVVLVLLAVLPETVTQLLEIELLATTLIWILSGALAVDTLNALSVKPRGARAAALPDVADLRLRSLRLIGRVVVVLGLVLVISARLVGKGTIYQWVLSMCWIATVPVLLVLIRWWRPAVFARTELLRKKSPLQQWILSRRVGWQSFIAAALGGAQLLALQTWKLVANWVGRFDTSRRLLAYLFRRELDKLEAEDARAPLGPLPAATIEALAPVTESVAWVPIALDAALVATATRIRERGGGLYALVGEKGSGKSSALRHLTSLIGPTVTVEATKGLPSLRDALAKAANQPAGASIEAIARHFDQQGPLKAVLLDDAQRLVQPVMGGLAPFDQLISLARSHSGRCAWVFSLDQVIWDFLQRARGARPLFDEVVMLTPWREDEIVELIKVRSAQAGVSASFERLLDRMPLTADEIDKREAVEERAASFYRLLWDYSTGNPGVAMHMWSSALGVDRAGTTFVRAFQGRDSTDLEQLPDAAIFVLRAVLQLAPAMPEEIARSTMVRPAEVADALRYALARGYVEKVDGAYRVSWAWFRVLTRFLQRRHLLVANR